MRLIFPPSLLDIRINAPFPKSQFQKFQPQTSSPQNTLSQYFHPNSANVVISNRRLQNSSRPKYISRPVNKIHGSCVPLSLPPLITIFRGRRARLEQRGGGVGTCCAHDAQIYMHAREHGVALVHKHALNT